MVPELKTGLDQLKLVHVRYHVYDGVFEPLLDVTSEEVVERIEAPSDQTSYV